MELQVKQFTLSVCTIVLCFCGCSSSTSIDARKSPLTKTESPKIVPGQEPDKISQDTILAAKDVLFKKLSERLMEVMSTQGPVAAIDVCQREAPQLAIEASKSSGVKIGRTGVRLRNPSNIPPSWAVTMIENKTEVPTFVMLDNGHAAGLLPIKLQAQCLMCHGPKDQIAPEVNDKLSELYPDDEAVGFQEGELRGWFWVELSSI